MTDNTVLACLDMPVEALWAGIEAAAPLPLVAVASDPPWFDDDEASERRLSQADRRRSFIARYAWAVPDRHAIAAIAAFVRGRRLLEVGAGSGLWACLLGSEGVDVVATDYYPPDAAPYVPVEIADAADAIQKHPECPALLLCWPPYRLDCAYRSLHAFAGDRIIFIGDARFTGDKAFHDLLEREWRLADQLSIPAWPGLDDRVYLYEPGIRQKPASGRTAGEERT